MEIKNMFQLGDLDKNKNISKYIPSSSEKKRAVMMYLFFGIMVSITKKEMNIFEYYHLKQSSGRWILFLFVLIFDVVLLFVPVLKYLWLIPLILLVVCWFISTKQARDGKYYIENKDSYLAIFSWIGNWFIELFEISVDIPKSLDWVDVVNDDTQSDIEKDLDKK